MLAAVRMFVFVKTVAEVAVCRVQSAWLALCLAGLRNVAALSLSRRNETGFLSHLGSLFNLKF